MEYLENIGKKVKNAEKALRIMNTNTKNIILGKIAEEILNNKDEIINANKVDIENAKKKNMKESLIDRLLIDDKRVLSMVKGIKDIINLEDPIGEVIEGRKLENGLEILKKRVPLGTIAIIYESRPNVTIDAFSLCFKSGNTVILRGGSDAINTNKKIVEVIRKTLKENGIDENVIYIIDDTSREISLKLMKLNKYIDVLIPRGGAGLIKTVVENSTVPIIETGTGNCHIYVDEFADFNMAVEIIKNAKTQRTGVCNACESLVINKNILNEFLPIITRELLNLNVEIRGDKECTKICKDIKLASEDDFYEEYLDLIISVKSVNNIEEAIEHINEHSTKHAEAIITSNYNNATKFLNEIDSSTVYVNASTRFTDGGEFGFGAEIGISTQKLHSRGPMGIKELTTIKYEVLGNGQIRK